MHFAVPQGKRREYPFGRGIKPDVALSLLHPFLLACRAILLSRREICLSNWWCYGKRRIHGLGSKIAKGEDGCEFAAWNKPFVLKNYLEISSSQSTIMFTCIFLASHVCTFLNFQNQWIGGSGVKFAWLSEVLVY